VSEAVTLGKMSGKVTPGIITIFTKIEKNIKTELFRVGLSRQSERGGVIYNTI
jgi:hypothetical protein